VFSTVTLHDGRTLEYADLGDPAGRPVLFFHGTPATAGAAAVVADAARAHGIRLVAPSRPGYGASTTTPPGLTPVAADACELADRLGLQEMVAMGISGGAPYALALAALAPDRIESAAVLGGPGSHAEVTPEELDESDRRAIELMREGEHTAATAILMEWTERVFGPMREMSDEEFHVALQKTRPPGENWLEAHPDLLPLFEADFHRAIATFDGFVRDNLSWLGDWDFDLDAVTAPVRLVHGADDRMVPAAHGDWLRERLPTSEQHVVPGGHGHATFGGAVETFRQLAGDAAG
jgi:pimeloyl-ACP methyl ester carboxylesterase